MKDLRGLTKVCGFECVHQGRNRSGATLRAGDLDETRYEGSPQYLYQEVLSTSYGASQQSARGRNMIPHPKVNGSSDRRTETQEKLLPFGALALQVLQPMFSPWCFHPCPQGNRARQCPRDTQGPSHVLHCGARTQIPVTFPGAVWGKPSS